MAEAWWMLLFPFLGPTPEAIPAVEQPQQQVQAEAPQTPPETMIGLLTVQYDQKCVGADGTDVEWVNPHLELGFSELTNPVDDAATKMTDKVVMLKVDQSKGKPKMLPSDPMAFAFSCVPMQMRSDWVPAKGGIRINQGLSFGGRWTGIVAKEFKVLNLISLKSSGPDVLATVTNDSGITLEKLSVVFHYEGCYGKPGSLSESRELGTMKPGEKKLVKAPAVTYGKRVRNSDRLSAHTLRSIQLQSQTPGVVVDLDMPVTPLGIVVECPEE